jgi:dolichyl-phosphate beta-glucosyltransferase
MDKVKLSVIIPAYNEAGRIGPTLARINEYLTGLGMDFEVVVVDDGSTDSTPDLVREAALSMPSLRLVKNGENRGKGYSVKNGFMNSGGGLVLFSDADLSTPIEELERFLPEVENGADIVIGSRAMRESNIIKRQPLYRMLMGKTFNKIVRVLTVRGINDTQCGFKLFRRDTCGPVFSAQKVERFAFDAELLFLAQKKGLKVVELPVRWINSPLSKVDVVRDSLRMLFDVLSIRWNYLAGKYRFL